MTELPVAHANWILILPDNPKSHPDAAREDTTTKSLIYVNKSLPTASLAPVVTNSNCIAAVRLHLLIHSMKIINAYAPPKQPHKLTNLRPLLLTSTSDTTHLIVAIDCNLHRVLWNFPTYTHTHCEAKDLILTISEAGLDLRLECGTPTPAALTRQLICCGFLQCAIDGPYFARLTPTTPTHTSLTTQQYSPP